MDLRTFGDSKASETLVKLLDQYDCKSVSNKVSRFIISYRERVYALNDIKDKSIRRSFLELLNNDFKNKIDKIDIPTDIKSYCLNIINALFKMQLRNLIK